MRKQPRYDEENISQIPAIEVLQKIGYENLTPIVAEEMRGNLFNVLLKPILKEKLNEMNTYEFKGKEYSFTESNIEQAIRDLDEPLTSGLVKANESIYETLMKGRTYTEFLPDGSRKSFAIQFIDWDNIENNVFHIVEEFSVERADGRGDRKSVV